jgi:uncharacterized protein YifN (PemK superfamily)
MVLICDYSTGFKPPEMVKRRPVVVESCHHQLDPASLPGPLSSTPTWAKCDMLATVSLDRLDRVKLGRDAKGKRLYSTQAVTEDDFKEIQRSVLHALGFHQLTKIVP